MRAVIDFQHDRLLMGDRRAMHMALRIAVEAARRQRHAGRDVFVASREAKHELVGGVMMRLRDAGALGEADERDRRPARVVAPQHLLGNALERFLAPWHRVGLDQDFLEIGSGIRQVQHGLLAFGAARPTGGQDMSSEAPDKASWAGPDGAERPGSYTARVRSDRMRFVEDVKHLPVLRGTAGWMGR